MTRAPRNSRRAGWQLIELSFVLGAFALVSVAATRLIVGLIAVENRSGRELQEGQVLHRLAQQWRDDLHRASSATISDDEASLKLILAAGRLVEYRVDGDRLIREQLDQRRRRPSRESYAVAARRWRFERSPDGRIITLARDFAPAAMIRGGGAAAPPQSESIDAAIGLLVRSSKSGPPEGGPP